MAEEKTRIDELTEAWQARGLKYDDAAEFINLLLEALEPEESLTEPAAPGSLDHLEILMERQTDVLYKLLTNSGRSEDLLREMLESLARIEESLIVAKPCDHEWVTVVSRSRGPMSTVCRLCGKQVPLT